jgi:hypothetical protein
VIGRSFTIKRLVGTSDVRRPYVISVDGDIPEAAVIKLSVNGMVGGSLPWRREYINPQREPLVTPMWNHLFYDLCPAPNTLAVPFLYAITIEGDNQKWEIDATALAADQDISQSGWCLNRPEEGRPYITNSMFQGARVSASSVMRPWIFEIDGHAATGAELKVPVSGVGLDGVPWTRDFSVPCRDPLPVTLPPQFYFGLSMRATPDGVQSPSLSGLVFEGDGRRFYISAATFAENLDMTGLRLMRFSDEDSVLMMQWIEPQFAGQPPSILNRLNTLFEQGKLRPGVPFFDE